MRGPISLFIAAFLTLAPLTVSAQTAAPASGGDRISLQALRQKYADPDGRYTKIGGVEVYYKDEGSGPAILMIHGSVSTLHTWDGVAARLKKHYRVIRYDIPPLGLSGSVSDEQAAALKPTDIPEGLMAQLGVTHATVIGVSSGGTLSVFLAAKRPDLVDRLVLSNTPADPVDTSHLQQSPALIAAQARAKATGFQDLAFWNAFLDYFSGDPSRYSAKTREQYYDMNRRPAEKHPIALVAVVADHARAVEAMSEVKAPTLLIWGGADPLLPAKAADVLAHYLTGTQVSKVILPDVGHYVPLEVPDRYAQILAAYIEAVTPHAAPSR